MFLLLVSAWTCVIADGVIWVDTCCNSEQCHLNCAAAPTAEAAETAAAEKTGLSLQPLAESRHVSPTRPTSSDSLLHVLMVPSRVNEQSEAELEELITAKGREEDAKEEDKVALLQMREELGQQQKLDDGSGKVRASRASLSNLSSDDAGTAGGAAAAHARGVMSMASLKARQQHAGGGTAAAKLNHTASNHSDDRTGKGRQRASQSLVSNRGSVLDAGRTTGSVPISPVASSPSTWRQLLASLRFENCWRFRMSMLIVFFFAVNVRHKLPQGFLD